MRKVALICCFGCGAEATLRDKVALVDSNPLREFKRRVTGSTLRSSSRSSQCQAAL